jgi:hypothetical protein
MEGKARAFVDEVRGSFEQKNWMLDLGHPLLNRIADSFVKATGVRSYWLLSHLCFHQNLSPPSLLYSPSLSRVESRSAQRRRSQGNRTSWRSMVKKPFCCCG